jgi:hypothetical protein
MQRCSTLSNKRCKRSLSRNRPCRFSKRRVLAIRLGTPVWGTDAAMKRFVTLYQGTWRLDPESAGLKIIMLGEGVAQLYVPIMFMIGPAGHSAQPTRFLMNQLLVKTASGWKVSSILPIPAPTQ